jgi:phosphoribosyl 1,2-cyclic phosphodiesterase
VVVIHHFIKSFGSSSKGNSILVGDVLLDAGIKPSKINPKPKSVFITHRHGDHIKYMNEWMKRGINVYSGEINESAFGKIINPYDTIDLGYAKVTALPSLHDTENALNFIVETNDYKVLYEVDNAKRIYDVYGITHYIAECNWDEQTLMDNNLDEYRTKRLRATHKSLEILLEELEEMDKSKLKEVWIAHASETNLNKELAKITIQEKVGVPVYFAQ